MIIIPNDNKIFIALLKSLGLPIPVQEYKFMSNRKFRFDYCWVNEKIALEVEGGAFQNGRHVRGTGFIKDIEKYNYAVLLGYRLLRVIPKDLCTMNTIKMIKELIKLKELNGKIRTDN